MPIESLELELRSISVKGGAEFQLPQRFTVKQIVGRGGVFATLGENSQPSVPKIYWQAKGSLSKGNPTMVWFCIWRRQKQPSCLRCPQKATPNRRLFEPQFEPVNCIAHSFSGFFGVVCSGKDEETGAPVAIKKLDRAFDDLSSAKQALRELKILRHLRHETHLQASASASRSPA